MAQKNILVNGQNFPCRDDWSVDKAESKIRSGFLLAGGFLQDQNGALDGTVLIRDTVGNLSFVAGQPAQQGIFSF